MLSRFSTFFLLMVVGEVQLRISFSWGLLTAVHRVELITEGLEPYHESCMTLWMHLFIN